MSEISHDFPPETLVVVTIDCSHTGAPSEEFVSSVRAEALALLEAGETEKAANVMQQAARAAELIAASQTGLVSVRPMTDEEIAQREADQARAAADADAASKADAARAALKEKLAAGSASDAEVQQALAALL